MAFTLPGFGSRSIDSMVTIANGGNGTTQAGMAAATAYLGCVFMATVSENMIGCVVQFGGNVGTPSSTVVDLYAVDANGYPTGASLATATFSPTSNVVNTVTFAAAYAVTAGTAYALVFRNATGTPASNYASLRTQPIWAGNLYISSADSGATWVIGSVTSLCCAPQYNTAGVVAYSQYNGFGAGTAIALYNTTGSRIARVAMKCNFEMDVLLWTVSVAMNTKTGSPNFGISGQVCSDSGVLSTSSSSYPSNLVTGTVNTFWDTPYRLLANTDYYIGITPTTDGNGSAGNCYNPTNALAVLNPANLGPIVSGYTSTGTTPSWSVMSKPLNYSLGIEIPKPNQYFYAGMRGGFNG